MNFSVLSPNILRWIRLSALIATLFLCLATIFSLGREVVLKLDALKVANTDSAQWTFAQMEVDYFRYKSALEAVELKESTNTDEIRRQFDIFYSRVAILNDSPMYNEMLQDSYYQIPLGNIQNHLNKTTSLVDGNDQALFDAVPELSDGADLIAKDVRNVALRGLQLFISQSDTQRTSVATTLLRLAILTAAMVGVLSLVAILMFRMYRTSNQRGSEIRETATRMASVLTSSLDAIIVIDQDGYVIEYNGAASKIFGYSVEEAMGQQMETLLIPPRYFNAHRAGMKRFIDTRHKRVLGAGRIELEALHKNGHTFPVELSIDTAEQDGRLIFVSFLRDITAEKAAQKELVKARDRALAGEKAKAEFLAVMSHEMRTPLNGLLGTLSLLEDTGLSDKQKLFLDNMNESGRTLLRHVNDVLDISKFEAGQITLESEQFLLSELIESIIESEAAHSTQTKNNFKVEWHGDKINTVIGDQTKLRQILSNLISNANKFTDDGQITVHIKFEDQFSNTSLIEFRVVDTGIGIKHEDIDRIFKDFETLDSTYGRQNDGTGLGLGIARRVVQLMGGQMGVDSIPGQGSTFWFRVKLGVAAQESHSPWETIEAQPQRALEILMVEDNQINRFVLRGMLEAEGHTIDEAENGRLGVVMSERKKYDLVLMDISMPVMDGMEATKTIRTGKGLSSKTPIVAVTAHALPEELEQFRTIGITDCLRKPLDKKRLHALITKFSQTTDKAGTHKNGGTDTLDTESDILDFERIDMMKDQLGEENLNSLLGRVYQEMQSVVHTLKAADPNSTDVGELIPDIHKVAGSAAALGITGIHRQLNLLEIAGKGDNPETMWDGVENLYVVWTQCAQLFSERFDIK